MVDIGQATSHDDIAAARALFQEYADWLGVDLRFQGFATELATLPGAYAPPSGRLLLAKAAGQPFGCCALRRVDDATCEMKRMFVRPEFRRTGAGRQLAEAVIAAARRAGYATMVLDTLSHMQPALALYESLGFVRRPAYYETPLVDTVFMELRLQ